MRELLMILTSAIMARWTATAIAVYSVPLLRIFPTSNHSSDSSSFIRMPTRIFSSVLRSEYRSHCCLALSLVGALPPFFFPLVFFLLPVPPPKPANKAGDFEVRETCVSPLMIAFGRFPNRVVGVKASTRENPAKKTRSMQAITRCCFFCALTHDRARRIVIRNYRQRNSQPGEQVLVKVVVSWFSGCWLMCSRGKPYRSSCHIHTSPSQVRWLIVFYYAAVVTSVVNEKNRGKAWTRLTRIEKKILNVQIFSILNDDSIQRLSKFSAVSAL